MAPEIYKNEKANSRVDIYSLGLVMYRMLNGNRLPFFPLTGEVRSSDSNEALIDMEIYDREEGTEIVFNYLPLCYKEESMNRFRRIVMKAAALLVQYAEEPKREIDWLLEAIMEARPDPA
jgi:serine/threonine-protein kinase